MVKLVTYNIHGGLSRAGRPMLPDAVGALADLDPDVVACQEMLAVPTRGHEDQAAWLADQLGMCWRFAVNARTRSGPLGNATFHKRAIIGERNLDLSLPGCERRGALRTCDDSGLAVWNVHLGLTNRQRAHQWRQLQAALAAESGSVLVCGDFNDWTGALNRRIATDGFDTALVGRPRRQRATFPSHRPLLGLDRVYFRGLRLLGAQVLRGAPWSHLSDHLPVEATFAIDRHTASDRDRLAVARQVEA